MSSLTKDQETLNTWNDMAQMYYDRFMDLAYYEISYESFLSRLRACFDVNDLPSCELLDIGCGPGVIGKYFLSSSASSWIHLTGVDIASNMIEIAAQHFPMYSWLTMDARQITTLQQKYHGILIGFCIPYLSSEDVQVLLSDVYNLLHSNGVLYLSFVPGSSELSGYKSNNKGQRVYFQYHEEATVRQWLEAAGFGNIQSHAMDFPRPNNQTEIHLALIATKEK